MNRQIKFRAWDSSRNEMITEFGKLSGSMPEILQNEDDGYIFCGHYEENGDWFEPILMQFTGLHDKNGKEIYEGDILRHHSYEDLFWRGVVKFSHGVFGVEWLPSEKNLSMLGSWGQLHNLRKLDDGLNEKQIVIGNIYQNPELLNK